MLDRHTRVLVSEIMKTDQFLLAELPGCGADHDQLCRAGLPTSFRQHLRVLRMEQSKTTRLMQGTLQCTCNNMIIEAIRKTRLQEQLLVGQGGPKMMFSPPSAYVLVSMQTDSPNYLQRAQKLKEPRRRRSSRSCVRTRLVCSSQQQITGFFIWLLTSRMV